MSQHEEQHTQHSVGYGRYILIWLGLLAFTGITVTLAGIDLGRWVIITSLVIASIKSILVLNVFMHLKFEDKMFKIFVLVAVATLVIFISLTFFDYAFY
ncbi:MAG: cytochrome-c oxidase [Chlorobiaceae bacterium]|nr:cytochrome-c oxidase [Chlorobiaceae bacterium]